MELLKKAFYLAIFILAVLVYYEATTPAPDKPEPAYEPVQTQQIRNTGWSTEWKMQQLEDRMDRMAEQQRRDKACFESGSSFC